MSLKALGLATAAGFERRQEKRRRVQSLVYLTIAPGNGGILHDLNESGMRVSMANPLSTDAECRFSIVLGKRAPVKGVARVAWLSESGKAAGLRFVEMPEDARRQIRQWLASNAPELVADESRTGADGAKTGPAEVAPSASRQTQASPGETESPAKQAQTPLFLLPERRVEGAAEADAADAVPPPASPQTETWPGDTATTEAKAQSPLFFLPHTRIEDVTGPQAAMEESSPAKAGEQGGLEEVRLALTQSPSERERQKKGMKRELLFAFQVVCVAALVLVGGFLVIYKGGSALQYVKQYAPFDLSLSSRAHAEQPVSRPVHERKPSRRFHRFRREATARQSAGATPSVWTEPRAKAPLQLEVTDSFNRRWLITASGQKMIPAGFPQITEKSASTPNEPETQPADAADEPAGPAAPTGNAAGSVEASVSDGVAIEPNTIVPPSVQSGAQAPFAVVLDALIGADGNVKDVHVVSSPSSALAWAVVEAVKQWHYPPFYRGGHPAEVVTRITVAFRGSTPKH